jgi:murein DD-endopeptidase MepM/ murein hydrolase activator NlpD
MRLEAAHLRLATLLALLIAASVGGPLPDLELDAQQASQRSRGAVYRLIFPVDGEHRFSRDFGDPRGGGRSHEGTDILAAKMTPVVAAADGTVRYMADERGGDCCAVFVVHDDGWRTRYIHLNNDTPGTDDGKAYGIARGIRRGSRVRVGQVIGWVGDSGNAEATVSHLHFELRRPDGTPVDPFPSLQAALANPVTAGTPRIAGPAIRPPQDRLRPEVRRPRRAPPVDPRPPVDSPSERSITPVLPGDPELPDDAELAELPDEEAPGPGGTGEGATGEGIEDLLAEADPVTPFLPVPGDDCSAGYSSLPPEVELAEVREPEPSTFSCFRFRSDDEETSEPGSD